MPSVTQTQLNEASEDCVFIGKVATGAADLANPGHDPGTATNRLGGTSRTIAKVIVDIDEMAAEALADAVETLAISGYTLFPDTAPAAVKRIKLVRIFGGSVGKFYSIKQIYYRDSGTTRFVCSISQSDDAAMTNEVLVCEVNVTTGANYTSPRQVFTATAVGGSGITATIVIDFSDNPLSGFFAYDASCNYATAGLPIGVVIPAVDVSAQIEAALAADTIREERRTFLSVVRDNELEDWITDISIEGGDPGHQYMISQVWFEYYPGIPLYRWKVRIHDYTLGIDVCEYGNSSSTDPRLDAGRLPEWGRFVYGTITTGFTGITGNVKIDWSKVTWTGAIQRTYTLPSQSGINPVKVHTNDQMDSFLFGGYAPKNEILVGATQTFTTVTAAVNSLHRWGLVQNSQSTTLPWSDIVGYSNQYLITVVDDDHHEDLNELIMSPWITIRGKGIDNTIFTHTSPDTNERLAEFRHSGAIEDCTWIQRGGAYIIHSDAFNDFSIPAVNGPAIQRFRIRKAMRRVKLRHEGNTTNAWGWGSGLSSWEYQLFEDCIFERAATSGIPAGSAIIGIHTAPNSSRPGTVHFRRCTADSYLNSEVALLSGFGMKVQHHVLIEDCDLKLVSISDTFVPASATDMPVKARNIIAWHASGDGIVQYSSANMKVLQVPAGATVGGTAKDKLLGELYDQKHGRGENSIVEANAQRKLGAIIGDRTSVSETLVINGVTHTFSGKNYTPLSEATILAEMNATFGASTVSVVNLAQFIIPPGQRRNMVYGATIAAKRFVSYVSDKAQLATGRPDGFTMEAGVTDAADTVYEERTFAATMIPELATYEGEFKVVAGVATATSAGDPLSCGEVYNGVVVLYD